MQTICPHCQTVFKVSDEHLKAADGYVRCGICKEVFNALETDLSGEEAAAETEITNTAETATQKEIEPDNTDSVDLVLEQSDEVSVSDDQENLTANKVITDTEEETPATESTDSDENAQTDLFTASAELKETELETELVVAEAIKAEEEPEAIKPDVKKETIAAETVKTETSEPDSPVTELETDEETSDNAANDIPEPSPVVIATASASSATEIDDDSDSSNIDNSLFDGIQSKLIPDEYRIPELHNTYSFWQDLAWTAAILIFTASLFIEYAWFNRAELINNPQLRPLVSQLCTIASCELMELREPSEIEMTTRNIYTHPNVQKALMISGTLINHSEFNQPYPNILIDFSNVRGEVIASRTFTPEDYLQIKATSLRPLPPRISIDFNMEIQDPGKQAMTYEFSFL